ncbi:hypothetical protein [Baaleninema sp.]|uniref:hypothetical protein n=1 Tax=Baaleninema sp. TaxID=3101197 RepID=UPI003D027C9A
MPSLYVFITEGLDAAWTFALTETALQQLQFGRDVIFTYGLLGYLASGSVVSENVLFVAIFKFGIHVVLIFVLVLQYLAYKTTINRFLWAISSIFLFHVLFSIDYKVLFLYLILLSWSIFPCFNLSHLKDCKTTKIDLQTVPWLRLYSFFLGGLAGFLALVKFTLGVATVGALFLVQVGRAISTAKTSSPSEANRSLFALGDSIVGAASIAFVFVAPNPLTHAIQLLLYGAIAGMVAAAWEKWRFPQNPNRNTLRAIATRAYGIYSLGLLATVFLFDGVLLDFVRGSLEMSSGYSGAMSYIRSPLEVAVALLEAALVASLMWKRRSWQRLGWYLALAFVLWIVFKHGFVRQDAHVLLYFFFVPFLTSLVCIDEVREERRVRLRKPNVKSWGLIVRSIAIAITLLYAIKPDVLGQAGLQPWPFWQAFTPKSIQNQVYLFDLDRVVSILEHGNQYHFERLKLPDDVREHLGTDPVDIVPWELTLAPANDLN